LVHSFIHSFYFSNICRGWIEQQNLNDAFRESLTIDTRKYDICIVLPLDRCPSKPCGTLTKKGGEYIVKLRRLGFEMITQYGTQPQKELFVLLRLPMKKTISVATKVALPMELDSTVLKVSTNIGISS
jgi:hypothetical protein